MTLYASQTLVQKGAPTSPMWELHIQGLSKPAGKSDRFSLYLTQSFPDLQIRKCWCGSPFSISISGTFSHHSVFSFPLSHTVSVHLFCFCVVCYLSTSAWVLLFCICYGLSVPFSLSVLGHSLWVFVCGSNYKHYYSHAYLPLHRGLSGVNITLGAC